MSKIVPLILELDEELSENEEMIDIKTIGLNEGGGNVKIGYVAVIKNFNGRNDLRYGNLKATRYERGNINKIVL
jgi:hypothetical protein